MDPTVLSFMIFFAMLRFRKLGKKQNLRDVMVQAWNVWFMVLKWRIWFIGTMRVGTLRLY